MAKNPSPSLPAHGPAQRGKDLAAATAASLPAELATPLDPLLTPLLGELFEINQRLRKFRQLVDFSIEQIRALYKSATLVGRKKAAVLLDMSESQFDRHVHAGKLENIYFDRRTRVSLADLEKLVAARRIHGRPKKKTAPQGKANCHLADRSAKTSQKKTVQAHKPGYGAKRLKPSHHKKLK